MTRQQLIAIAALTSAAILSVFVADYTLSLWIEKNTTEWMRVLGGWLEESGKSHWVLGYAAIISAVAWRSYKSVAHRHLILFGSVALSGIASIVMKILVCRPRPPMFLNDGITQPDLLAFHMDWVWNSFPSGHATTGIAIAIAGAYTWPKLKWLMWLIGLSIAFGRVLYNVHYLSDVLSGIIVGAVISWWFIKWIEAKHWSAL